MKLKFRAKLSSKQLKEQQVLTLNKELSEAKSLVLFSSEAITHKAFEDFRVKLAEHKAKLRFVKNTLFKVSATAQKLPKELYQDSVMTGSTAVIYILSDDFISPIKALSEQFKDQKNLKVKIAFLDKELYSSDQVLEFSKIPSTQELQAKLVGILNNPIQKFYYALNDSIGKLVRSLKAIAEKGVSN